jgi:hypothetical protein
MEIGSKGESAQKVITFEDSCVHKGVCARRAEQERFRNQKEGSTYCNSLLTQTIWILLLNLHCQTVFELHLQSTSGFPRSGLARLP